MERLQILWIGKSYSLAHAGVKPHQHPYYHGFYITSGQAMFTVNGDKLVLKAGQCLLVPKGTEHAYFNDTEDTMEYLEIKFSIQQPDEGTLSACGMLICEDPTAADLFQRIIREYSENSQSDEAARAYLMALINILTEGTRTGKKRASKYIDTSNYNELSKRIIQYLERNYTKELSLDELAAALGYNKSYLCVAFKRDTHSTILDCLNMVRIRRAAELIVYSDYSLSQVADLCGFASDSHFNRVFVKYVGITPGQCRRAYPANIVFEPKYAVPPTDRPSRFMYNVLAQKHITPQMIRNLDPSVKDDK